MDLTKKCHKLTQIKLQIYENGFGDLKIKSWIYENKVVDKLE